MSQLAPSSEKLGKGGVLRRLQLQSEDGGAVGSGFRLPQSASGGLEARNIGYNPLEKAKGCLGFCLRGAMRCGGI